MSGFSKVARSLAGAIGNASALLLGNVFAWLWLSALLIFVGAFVLLAPIDTVGKGGRSLTEVLAMIGGFLLVGAVASWAWHKLGEEGQRIALRVGESLGGLAVFAAIVSAAAWSWWTWDVPDIWHRPLVALTLADIAQNLLKLAALLVGVTFVTGVFRELVAHWKRG
jgi:hypothetical protein